MAAKNNLWISIHSVVCIFPTGGCRQEDYLHLDFWHILQFAV